MQILRINGEKDDTQILSGTYVPHLSNEQHICAARSPQQDDLELYGGANLRWPGNVSHDNTRDFSR